jgi:endonuclease/exonuclease/phosphatase family metal-dependent hydrolase
MTSSPHASGRDPGQVREAHELRTAFAPFATLQALHASPGWPALSARLAALLSGVRRFAPAPTGDAAAPATPLARTLRVVHWNIEHGNRYDAIAQALAGHPRLAPADVITLNEVDLGMARSGNRDVAGELAARLGMHSAWAPLFLESTRGRDDDLLTALPEDNAESLFGLALLSRWPISTVRLVPLPGPEQTLFEGERMTGRFVALVCDIAHPVTPFVAVTVHLEVHRTRAHRATQMRLLLAALAGEKRPVLLTGDWNTHTFDRGERDAVLAAAWPLLAWSDGALARRLRFPDSGPRREPLFDELQAAGFAWQPYVDREPTLGMRFSRLGEVHAMPGPLRSLASRGMAWVERRARLRLDWIAARGFASEPASGETVPGLDGPGLASDHAPITATLALPA